MTSTLTRIQELQNLINTMVEADKKNTNSSYSNNRNKIDANDANDGNINAIQAKKIIDIYIQTQSRDNDTKLIVMQLVCKLNQITVGHAVLTTDPIIYDKLIEKTKYLHVLDAINTEDIFTTIMNWLKNDLQIDFTNITLIHLHNRYFMRDFQFFLGPQRIWLSDANLTYKPILIFPEKVLRTIVPFTSKDRKKLFNPNTFPMCGSGSGNFQLHPNVNSDITLEAKRKIYSIFKQNLQRRSALESKLFLSENRNGIKLMHDSKPITFLLHPRFGWNKNAFNEFHNFSMIIQNYMLMPDDEEEDEDEYEYEYSYPE